jgi:hypothetical protein
METRDPAATPKPVADVGQIVPSPTESKPKYALKDEVPKTDEYTVASSMAQYESSLFWTIMGVFLVPESVLLGFLGNALADNILLLGTPALWITSLIGAAITVFWSAALARSSRWHDLRVIQARRFEEEVLNSRVFRDGKTLSDLGKIEIGDDTIQFPWVAKWLTLKRAGRLIVDVFAVTFGVAAAVATSAVLF